MTRAVMPTSTAHPTRLVRMTRNRQVSIPKRVADALGLNEGVIFSVEARAGDVVFTPKTLTDFEGRTAAERAREDVGLSPVFTTIVEGKRWMAQKRRQRTTHKK